MALPLLIEKQRKNMNNVLIAVDTSESSFWLAYYAIGLSKRIFMNVSILMIDDKEYSGRPTNDEEWIGLPEKNWNRFWLKTIQTDHTSAFIPPRADSRMRLSSSFVRTRLQLSL